MVISDKHNFIFIRIPKNASTSLATFFVRNCCNANDRYTGIGDARIPTQGIDKRIIDKYRTQYRFIHLTIDEILKEGIVSATEIIHKKIIGVLRHPLDRQLSLFFFKHRRSNDKSPETFRREMARGFNESDGSNHILQVDYLTTGNTRVGKFWLYDNLESELTRFVNENNIVCKEPIQQFKSNFRAKGDLIKEYYDKPTRLAVENYFARDIEQYEILCNEN